MKKLKLVVFLISFSVGYSQSLEINKNTDLYKNAPEWAKLMFSENPDVIEIDQLYYEYFRTNAYKKSTYTQYYKHWRRGIDVYLDKNGKIDPSKKIKQSAVISKLRNDTQLQRLAGGNWTALGPFKNPNPGGVTPSGGQANIVSLARCEGTPTVMYCGTEPGEVYRTADGGQNWVNASKTLVTQDSPNTVLANVGVFALAVHPTNPNIVYAGSGTQVFKTTDGGNNWVVVHNSNMQYWGYVLNPAELYISPANPEIVLVAGKEGIYRTSNGGATEWAKVLDYECYDIKAKPGNSNILYTVRRNDVTNTHEFLTSTDAGLTWTPQTTGWYTSTNDARSVTGARIAVSAADSNRVYAYLVGDSKPGDQNFIGLYKSTNGGVSWVNTQGYDGGPYTTTHLNLVRTSVNGGFSNITGDITMNMAIMASNTNADHILVGGIGMNRSTDAGQTFTCKYNYECSSGVGVLPLFHVDSGDYRAFGNEYWATTDGGVFKSNDFFNTNSEFKMDGVRGVDFWGFGSGWNRDILMGGTYHNGVDAYAEGFPAGTFLNLIGGEPASGYVSPSNESRVFSTSLGSKYLPQTISGPIIDAPGMPALFQVNESPWYAESSEMEFHPTCFNHIYKGYENKVFKSVDGGENYTAKYTAAPNSRVLGIEISRRNTNTMYVVVRSPTSPTFLGTCTIVKTTNDWATSTIINLPESSNHKTIISLDPENDQIIWLAFAEGGNNNLVYQSIDGGANWINKTTNILNGQTVQSIVTIGGTNGGVYIGTNLTVYYKNNTMTDWTVFNENLPTVTNTHALRPFYRDGKLRMATYGKGIWETQLYEQPTRPLAKIMVDKLVAGNCTATFNFDDYSMLNHTNATWAWTFQDGNISTSSLRNPQVFFNTAGDHVVTLKVTNASGASSTDTITVTTNAGLSSVSASINQNFETNLLPTNWNQETNGNFNWAINNSYGGFGQSSKCMYVNNYSLTATTPLPYADINARINMTAISAANAILTFDVAYAFYNDQDKDKLQVIVSKDCGANYAVLYKKGGPQLATASPTTNYFVPTATQWRTESINLSEYIGTRDVTIKFRNVNKFAQPVYIDNIKLNGAALSIDEVKLETPLVYPNPTISNSFVTVQGNDNSKIKFNLFSIDGKLIDTIFTSFNTPIPLSNYNLKEGVFIYKIISEDKIQNGKLIISNK